MGRAIRLMTWCERAFGVCLFGAALLAGAGLALSSPLCLGAAAVLGVVTPVTMTLRDEIGAVARECCAKNLREPNAP